MEHLEVHQTIGPTFVPLIASLKGQRFFISANFLLFSTFFGQFHNSMTNAKDKLLTNSLVLAGEDSCSKGCGSASASFTIGKKL